MKNGGAKSIETEDFKRYRELHDSDKAFHIYKGVTRSWMNRDKGLDILQGLYYIGTIYS